MCRLMLKIIVSGSGSLEFTGCNNESERVSEISRIKLQNNLSENT